MTACQFQGYPSPASMRGTHLATVTRQSSAAPALLPIQAAGCYFRQGIRGISSSPTPAIPTTSPSIRTPWHGLSPQSPYLRAFLQRTFAGLEGAAQTPTANPRSLLPFDPLGDPSRQRGSHDLRQRCNGLGVPPRPTKAQPLGESPERQDKPCAPDP